jgi:hypothetical protein
MIATLATSQNPFKKKPCIGGKGNIKSLTVLLFPFISLHLAQKEIENFWSLIGIVLSMNPLASMERKGLGL